MLSLMFSTILTHFQPSFFDRVCGSRGICFYGGYDDGRTTDLTQVTLPSLPSFFSFPPLLFYLLSFPSLPSHPFIIYPSINYPCRLNTPIHRQHTNIHVSRSLVSLFFSLSLRLLLCLVYVKKDIMDVLVK